MPLRRQWWAAPRWRSLLAVPLAAIVLSLACGDGGGPTNGGGSALSGTIEIDGSSTVYPITQAMAEEFGRVHKNVKVTVGISGTGGGFKRFCAGETAISNASRPIGESEKKACAEKGIEYAELFVAFDGLSVIVNQRDTFVDCLTTAELRKIWDKGSTIRNWRDVRSGFPDRKLVLFGPGTDSGTFDYFTEEINGKAKQSRVDYTASEDDNALARGVISQTGALGYFGFAYYTEIQDKLRLLGVDDGRGGGCVKPSPATIEGGQYRPLSRPLSIYVSKATLRRSEVAEFVKFYLDEKNLALIQEVGYVKGDAARYQDSRAKLQAALPAGE